MAKIDPQKTYDRVNFKLFERDGVLMVSMQMVRLFVDENGVEREEVVDYYVAKNPKNVERILDTLTNTGKDFSLEGEDLISRYRKSDHFVIENYDAIKNRPELQTFRKKIDKKLEKRTILSKVKNLKLFQDERKFSKIKMVAQAVAYTVAVASAMIGGWKLSERVDSSALIERVSQYADDTHNTKLQDMMSDLKPEETEPQEEQQYFRIREADPKKFESLKERHEIKNKMNETQNEINETTEETDDVATLSSRLVDGGVEALRKGTSFSSESTSTVSNQNTSNSDALKQDTSSSISNDSQKETIFSSTTGTIEVTPTVETTVSNEQKTSVDDFTHIASSEQKESDEKELQNESNEKELKKDASTISTFSTFSIPISHEVEEKKIINPTVVATEAVADSQETKQETSQEKETTENQMNTVEVTETSQNETSDQEVTSTESEVTETSSQEETTSNETEAVTETSNQEETTSNETEAVAETSSQEETTSNETEEVTETSSQEETTSNETEAVTETSNQEETTSNETEAVAETSSQEETTSNETEAVTETSSQEETTSNEIEAVAETSSQEETTSNETEAVTDTSSQEQVTSTINMATATPMEMTLQNPLKVTEAQVTDANTSTSSEGGTTNEIQNSTQEAVSTTSVEASVPTGTTSNGTVAEEQTVVEANAIATPTSFSQDTVVPTTTSFAPISAYGAELSATSGTVFRSNSYADSVSPQEKMKLAAIVAGEDSNTYEGSLAVVSTVLNRCDTSRFSGYGGKNPYKQIVYPNQFTAKSGKIANNYMNHPDQIPDFVMAAVEDGLNGYRNHTYTAFRANRSGSRECIGTDGNWYFNASGEVPNYGPVTNQMFR